MTLSGYNTEFVEVEVPASYDYPGDTLSDYTSAPMVQKVKLAQKGATTAENFVVGIDSNDTSVTKKDTQLLTLDADTELRAWKGVFSDALGFSADNDGDGVYDDGINKLVLTVGSKDYKPFDVSNGINDFSPEGEGNVDFELGDLVVADEDDLKVAYEMDIDETSVDTGDKDEKLGDNETIGTLTIFDDENNQFAQITITA